MSKFRIKLELQGLKLEVEGTRDDVPMLAKNIGSQLAGMIVPAANMAEGRSERLIGRETIDVTLKPPATARLAKRSPRRNTSSAGANGAAAASGDTTHFEWKHDTEAWGSPLQIWKGPDKAMWLLYVSAKQGAPHEMTVPQISRTFDKMFKTAGKVDKSNLARDFGKLLGQPPAKISADNTKDPATWYLTDTGIKHAEGLVAAARGEPSTTAPA